MTLPLPNQTALRRAAVGLALVLAMGVAGCVSLFPKEQPAQLYRFSPQMAGPSASMDAQRIPISLSPIQFTAAASGDRLLTMTGDEAAYIEGARWVSTAQSQFDEAVNKAFDATATATRIVEPRQAGAAKLSMNLSVESFETRYDDGPKGAPKVVVALRAQIVRYPDRAVIGETVFHSEQPVSDNRVGAIVQGYDAAVTSVLKDLAAWTDQKAQAGAQTN